MTKMLLYLLAFFTIVALCGYMWPGPTFLVLCVCGMAQAPLSRLCDIISSRQP